MVFVDQLISIQWISVHFWGNSHAKQSLLTRIATNAEADLIPWATLSIKIMHYFILRRALAILDHLCTFEV